MENLEIFNIYNNFNYQLLGLLVNDLGLFHILSLNLSNFEIFNLLQKSNIPLGLFIFEKNQIIPILTHDSSWYCIIDNSKSLNFYFNAVTLDNLYWYNLYLYANPDVYLNVFNPSYISELLNQGVLDKSHNYLFYNSLENKYIFLIFNEGLTNIEYSSDLYIKLEPCLLIEKIKYI